MPRVYWWPKGWKTKFACVIVSNGVLSSLWCLMGIKFVAVYPCIPSDAWEQASKPLQVRFFLLVMLFENN